MLRLISLAGIFMALVWPHCNGGVTANFWTSRLTSLLSTNPNDIHNNQGAANSASTTSGVDNGNGRGLTSSNDLFNIEPSPSMKEVPPYIWPSWLPFGCAHQMLFVK
jgi:hypothetical protein